jgi:fatty-acid desaturase
VDNSYNNKIAAILLPGEGNHENHHVNPGAIKNALAPGDIDLGWWWIKLISSAESRDISEKTWKQDYHA